MAMNVKPVPTLNNEVNEIRLATADIVNREILPNEQKLWVWVEDSANSQNEVHRADQAKELRKHVQNTVKKAGLWAPHLTRNMAAWGCRFSSTPT